ncbi:MAG: TonB-dependent receptor, partial [bacterium]
MRQLTTYLRSALTSLGVLLATIGFAQTTGKLAGTVIDKDTKEGLPGVNLVVEGTTLGAVTDLDGKFIILRVPPGKHNLRASLIGYQTVIQQSVEVLTDLTTTINFTLSQEAVNVGEEVVIVAERPIIRKDLTSSEARVQAEEISRLPVQEVADVINLQAGIIRDAGGGIHIRGGRSTEVAYVVDGVRITDDFTRSQSLQIENESIQELQVVSGTFNAEYGQAMSGIINIVTKTGGNDFHGNFETWVSDYLSGHDEIFYNLDDINFLDNYNFQGSLSGPIFKERLTFFATARRWNDDGWLYGQNIFSPQGFIRNDSLFLAFGDGKPVPMNFRKRWSGQTSLEWRITGPLKLKLSALGSTEDKRNYDHAFKFNPFGDRGDVEKGATVVANLTHAVTPRTFYEIKAAYKYNELVSQLYDDPFDSRYVDPRLSNTGLFQFSISGTDLARFQRSTKSWLGKLDVTSQATNRHQVKAGVEVQFDNVFLEDITLVPAEDANGQQIQPFQPTIRPASETTHDRIIREPYSLAAYLQDKIEYESLIINVGLRVDLFDAQGRVPVDLEDPNIFSPFKLKNTYRDTNNDGVIGLNEQTDDNRLTLQEREAYWYRKAEKKYQISPRFGVAYPITERGVIHFSYGIFQQIPEYEQLY